MLEVERNRHSAPRKRVARRRRLPREGEVHVVAADLDRAPADPRLVCDDERERAVRYRFDRDRRRFLAGRATLRLLLAEYLDCAPLELEFLYGPYGKPSVRRSELSFNVSHSGRAALFAFAPGFEVGIDVELERRETKDDERVAARFFSAREFATMRAQPQDARPRAFLRCWTRKEAYVKARGDGLQLPLQDFDVAFEERARPALLRTAWSDDEPSEWTLQDVSSILGDAVAAFAARAPEVHVVYSSQIG